MSDLPSALVDRLREFVTIAEETAAIKLRLDALSARAKELEVVLREDFAASGIQNVNIDGKCVFLHRQIWTSAVVEPPILAAALRVLGAGDIVKESVNSQTLSSLVREYPRDKDDMPILPAELKGLVRVTDKVAVRIRQA